MSNSNPNIRTIPLDRIHAAPADRTADEELVASVKQHGVLQPVAVVADGKGFRPVFGSRRLDAARKAGLANIPATVFPADTPPADLHILTLVENVQRLDASPLEQGRLFAELVGMGLAIGEVARRVGKSPTYVRQRVTIATLPAHVLDLLPPEYSVSAAALLCRLPLPVLIKILENSPEASTDVEMARDAVRNAGRDLDGAPFPTSDCGSCRKRTGADRAAFGDIGGDTCFDPECYEEKVRRHVGLAVSTIRREHPTAPCIVTRDANRSATPALGELYASNGADPLPRSKRIAEEGEGGGTPAICLDGGKARLVHVTDSDNALDGRATRHTPDGQRALDLRRRLDDALDGTPRPVRDSDLPRLVRALAGALEGRDDVTAPDAWAALLRLAAPALRARIKPASPDADREADFRRIAALLP